MIQFVVLEVTQMKNFAFCGKYLINVIQDASFVILEGVNETSLDEVKVILANIK